MWTWPFKISPIGIGTIIAGVVVAGSTLAAWIVEDKVSVCNASWEWKIADANLRLNEVQRTAAERQKELEDKLRTAEEAANLVKVQNEQVLEKQREGEKLSLDCSKCRVPNAWIWVRETGAARSDPVGRATAQSRRVDAPKAP